MAVAIKTKFIGPSNTRGSRVKAETCDALREHRRSVTLEWDHALDGQDNHSRAAKALATKLDWDGEWHIADGGDVYLFVRVGTWSSRFSVEEGKHG